MPASTSVRPSSVRPSSVSDLLQAAAGLLPLPGPAPQDDAVAHADFEARSIQRQVVERWLTGRASRRSGELSVVSLSDQGLVVDHHVDAWVVRA